MIENKLDELIAALNANTEALKAASSAPAAAPATRAPRGSKTTTPAATPEPTKEEAAPANVTPIAAATPAAKGPTALTANDVKKLVKDTRTRLADVSGEAVKAHKEGSAKILKAHGLTDFTSIPDDKVESLFAAFKALNVEQPKDDLNDDLEDDDGL